MLPLVRFVVRSSDDLPPLLGEFGVGFAFFFSPEGVILDPTPKPPAPFLRVIEAPALLSPVVFPFPH